MSWLGSILGRFGRGGESHVGADRVRRSIEQRFNPMRQLTPENLSRWIYEFECGDLRQLARLLEAVSERDDMFKSTMRKAIRSVSRCDYDIRIEEGAEGSEEAKAHREVLVDFWRTVRATELLNQSSVGGVCRLVRQMMLAERDCHNVHELLWRVEGGKLRLTAVHVPLWMFENRTGHLRFLRDNFAVEGEPLAPGEWMVHSGDGVGIACAIAASYKRLTLADWLAYSEHNATPGLHAKTDARQGSPEWQRAVEAVRAFAQDWAIVTGRDVDMTKVDLGAGGSLPYPALVELMDKAIAALWRGSDLGTISAQAQGASLQGEEMDMLEQSAAEDISETLHEQIDRFVVEWHFGAGTEPLARFALVPVSRPDVAKEIAINEHLVSHGAKLSMADECQRFGRREVEGSGEDRAMQAPQQPAAGDGRPPMGGRGLGLWNEDTAGEPHALPAERRLAKAMQRDLRPVARAIAEGLKKRDWDALRKRLDGALKECGTESAEELAGAMVGAGEKAWPKGEDHTEAQRDGDTEGEKVEGREETIANEQSRVPSGNGNGGQFTGETNPPDGRAHGREPETKRQHDRFGSTDTVTLLAHPERNAERGKAAMDEVLRNHRTVEKAVYREETGWIQMEWGDPGNPHNNWRGGHGISHIQAKHEKDLKYLPEVLAKGDIYKHEEESKLYLVHESRFAVVASLKKGGKKTITEFEPNNPDKIALIKQNPRAHKPGEN